MVKFGVGNFLLVGMMAVVFIVVIKVILTKYPVAGLSEVVQSV